MMDKVKYEGKMIDHPCDHCVNPKSSAGHCTEICCYYFSRFEAGANTPKDTLNFVLDMQESL